LRYTLVHTPATQYTPLDDRELEVNSKSLIRLLEEHGWRQVRQVGSHITLKHPTNPTLCTVPHPKKDLPIGTVNAILKAAGLK
jgi:predicted RNA binding protein YcfA (HicA-like mRNA interferase family)